LFGNKNTFQKVDIVAALTGGEACQCSKPLDAIAFKEDIDADYQCVAWSFNCFYS
jgi:hypothetical protein